MKRKRLLPDFPGSPYEGWAHNFMRVNYWKIASTMGSFEDAMASSVVLYYECRWRYGDRVENAAHFMALYKRVMYSNLVKWARKTTDERDADVYLINHSRYSPRGENYGSVAVKIRDGSNELQDVISLICHAPQEVMNTLRRDVQDGFAFFQRVVEFCGYPADSAPRLQKELENLLA